MDVTCFMINKNILNVEKEGSANSKIDVRDAQSRLVTYGNKLHPYQEEHAYSSKC